MLELPRPCGASRSLDDPTVAMQRIIDQAMDLVPPSDALTGQDEAALARLTGFISTVAGAMWDLSSTAGEAVGSGVLRAAGERSRAQATVSDRVNHFIINVFRVAQASAEVTWPGASSDAQDPGERRVEPVREVSPGPASDPAAP